MKTGIRSILAIVGLAAALPSAAWAADPGDPGRGHAYAMSICGSCHSVEAEGASPVTAAPPLRDTAVGSQDGAEVAKFYNTAHPPAGVSVLKDTQGADIAAWIATLGKKG